MNNDRQKILTDYISYLYTTGRTYDTVGKYIKYVTDFLEMTKEVNRRGYLSYKRENADVMVRHSLMCSAICDLLSYLNIGYGKREKAVKPLAKLDVISDKNKKQLNDFIIWLTDNNDYSSHTVYIYYNRNMNQMNIELSKMQLIHLRNICKKGWGGYSKPSDDLEEMVKNGLLTKSAGPFGDVVYRPTDAGRSYINDFNNEQI